MREQPSAPELLEAVAEFLTREVTPQLSGRLAFHARVAANVLAIVRRELANAPGADLAEAARLRALLGREGDGDRLNAELCRRIAAGEIATDDPALIDHLWATTMATLAVDQPNYATYRRAAAAPETQGDA